MGEFEPVITNEDGEAVFTFEDAPEGTYSYTVQKDGFVTVTGEIDASEIPVGQHTGIVIPLLADL
jgi:hypothetical protein